MMSKESASVPAIPLRIAVQADPIQNLNVERDSTLALMLEAQQRGHYIAAYEPGSLTLMGGRLHAKLSALTFGETVEDAPTFDSLGLTALDEYDVILMRQDPPFNMAYITATHLLQQLPDDVWVINDPAGVRNSPEKIKVLEFAGLMPPTIISSDIEAIDEFMNTCNDVVIKPLHGNGGRGVFRVSQGDGNLASVVDALVRQDGCPVVIQQYLPKVLSGDKRVILLDGIPIGAINRVPAQGQIRSNLAAGGAPTETALTERDLEICEAIGQMLRDEGLVLVGIDIIGEFITEINVTSPTGLREIERLSGIDVAEMFWDYVEAELASE